jgi:2-dehydropantoate 2-reductase
MRLLVVGAGSTGGYFGGRLAQAGRDVTFLVRSRRAEMLRKDGLRIISPHHGDATLHPRLVTADAIEGTYDAVLLAVKAYSLDAALDDMAPAIGPGTAIVPLLNGMRHMDVLMERFGPEAVAGGVCKVAATVDDEGTIRQLAGFQDLAYGELDGRDTPRMQALDAMMKGAGFPARLSPEIEQEMWEKWVMLATMGAICCLMQGAVGQVGAAPGGQTFMLRVLDEVLAATKACGHPPREALVENIRQQLTTPGSNQTTSMFRDMQQGAPVEAEQIIGDLVARAAKRGVDTPLLAAAYTRLGLYQNGRATA